MIKILPREIEWIEEATDICDVDYISELSEDNYYDENILMEMIEDLVKNYRKKEEELERLERDLEENYRCISGSIF